MSEASPTSPDKLSTSALQLLSSSGPSRKQNVACDACRSRKVKCNQVPGQEKCQHCTAKNFECTHLIQQATSEKRRVVGNRRPKVSPTDPFVAVQLQTTYTPLTAATRAPTSLHSDPSPFTPFPAQPDPPYGALRQHTNSTIQLIDWLFSPPEETITAPPFVGGGDAAGYRNFLIRSKIPVPQNSDADWGDLKRHLQPDDLRTELANDLVEVYFQICHSRMPLLSPSEFRTRLKAYLRPTSTLDPTILPLPHALLATVIAWGAKFSEHPLLVHDRETNAGRSRICRILTRRAREVSEGEKIHRLPSFDNVIIALLLEPLQSHNPSDPDGFRGFWLNCGVRHLFELQINRRSRLAELDEDTQTKMTYAWWMACLSDAYAAVYWRRKPVIEDDDYDLQFMGESTVLPPDVALTTNENSQGWMASIAMAKIARTLARQLARPDVPNYGMPYAVLEQAMQSLHFWKDQYLQIVGVPNNFQADWDFIAAVSACTCDAQYHVMWVILHSALEEFHLREARNGEMDEAVVQSLVSQVAEEALVGALRIAGLTSVLTSNGYLRLDPNILHFSTYAAGMFLARHGKPEVKTCIKGLEQYSFAYEEAFEQAKWMQQVYASSIVAPTHVSQSLLSASSSMTNGLNAPLSAAEPPDSPLMLYMAHTNGSSSVPQVSPYTDSPSNSAVEPQPSYALGYSQ